jgi:hypothetical protein
MLGTTAAAAAADVCHIDSAAADDDVCHSLTVLLLIMMPVTV